MGGQMDDCAHKGLVASQNDLSWTSGEGFKSIGKGNSD